MSEYLNESILTAADKLSFAEIQNSDEAEQMLRQLEMWGEISRLIGVACQRLQDCFGAQISLSIFTSTVLYITLVYQGTLYLKTEQWLYNSNVADDMAALILYITINILIIVGGQRFQNEADKLDENLAILHNLLITRPEAEDCARSARALCRRLRAAPLRVRLQRALPVRAELLADMLAVVLNYTIILLQFNHVI